MINGKTILAVIPARKGSKAVPGKNIRPVNGKPLIAWTIDAARSSKYIDKLIVSTDGKDITDIAKEYKCEVPFIRPEELSGDKATSVDVSLHALEYYKYNYDIFMLLQPTSPLRTTEDIDSAVEFFEDNSAKSLVSVSESTQSPLLMFYMEGSYLSPVVESDSKPVRRQDVKKTYIPNGAIYLVDVHEFVRDKKFIFEDTIGYVMPPSRSIDLDYESDFAYLEYILLHKYV